VSTARFALPGLFVMTHLPFGLAGAMRSKTLHIHCLARDVH